MVPIHEFESQIWEVEGIRVIVRAPWDLHVKSYPYKNALNERKTVKKWVCDRVEPCLEDQQVVVIKGDGKHCHGGTSLKNARASYRSAI